MLPLIKKLLVTLAIAYVAMLLLATVFQRHLLYFPSHDSNTSALSDWNNAGQYLGCTREVTAPKHIWLVLHGNAGQASARGYILNCLPNDDAVYILEYPGYGKRPGSPSMDSFNSAASEAYAVLRDKYPHIPVNVLSESIGSGPASYLGTLNSPPDRIVLVVPFDNLPSVAQGHMPFLPAKWLLFDRWDNVQALQKYHGKVVIYGARNDRVIPEGHAKNLAANMNGAVFHEIGGGHNEWIENIGQIDGE
jgi:pimeloyl-ACP methyl ester carboxylesterase